MRHEQSWETSTYCWGKREQAQHLKGRGFHLQHHSLGTSDHRANVLPCFHPVTPMVCPTEPEDSSVQLCSASVALWQLKASYAHAGLTFCLYWDRQTNEQTGASESKHARRRQLGTQVKSKFVTFKCPGYCCFQNHLAWYHVLHFSALFPLPLTHYHWETHLCQFLTQWNTPEESQMMCQPEFKPLLSPDKVFSMKIT